MFSQNRRMIVLGFVLCLFLSSISVSTNLAGFSRVKIDISQPSSVVWSDDFENVTKTLSEWTIDGIYIDGYEYIPNVTVSDGLLYSNLYFNGTGINLLTHNSTTATGTWSVDVFPGEDFVYVMIFFMSPYWSSDYMGSPLGYTVIIDPSQTILGYWDSDPAGNLLMTLDSASISMTTGWYHIDITRQSDDMMYVYIDGVLWLQGEDSTHHSSEHFRLKTYGQTIFDNVTVSDTVDIIDHVSPYWIEPLVDQSITEGDDFLYSLHADDYAGLDTWWVTDSTHFAIDQEGTLTSVSPLAVGNYNVEVFVNDTFGNVLSGNFNLEVSEVITTTTTTGTPETLDPLTYVLLAISAGSGVVIIVVVLRIYLFKKTRI